MKIVTLTCSLLLLFSTLVFAQTNEEANAASEAEKYQQWALNLWNSLDRQTGEIVLPKAGATLNVPENFYYLNAADADKVLVDVWGNPSGNPTLGMLFPNSMTPFDSDAWAVTIEYEEEGYVSDSDADEINYDDLLEQMKEDTRQASDQRVSQGYTKIALIGWAAKPYYDTAQKKLHWAKEIKFGDDELNTLNYNIRVLGRKGVLVLNFIAGIDQKDIIQSELDNVLTMANFDQGAKYTDFNPDIDQVAAYGLGALVAGKVLAKVGFLAVALVFLKKFGVFILIGLFALFKGFFKRNKQ